MYDFNTSIDRTGTGSIKIDFAPEPVKGSGLVPLTIADQEFACAPEIVSAVKDAADCMIFGYTYGDKTYRDAVDNWMMTRHDWDSSGFKVVTTNGVVPALGIAIQAYTEPGDGVVIQSPVYMMFAHAIRRNDRRIVDNPLIYNDGRYEMDYDDLDAKTKPDDVKLLLLCSPHNPVGRVWSEDELRKLGEICIRNNVLIIADEIHNDLILPGNKHTVFASIPGMAEHCVTCTAVSKTFNLAGLSCSNIFFPNDELMKPFKSVCEKVNGTLVPYFARAATIAAYTRCAGWVDELNEAIDANYNTLYAFIDERYPMLHAIRAQGTYLAWVDMRALGLDDKALEKLMLDHGLAFDEGYLFGEGGSGFERWNLALPNAKLRVALDKFAEALNSVLS